MNKIKVEFCTANLAEGSGPVAERLRREQAAAVDVREFGCLDLCEVCDQGPYCLVAGELFTGASAEELWARVQLALQALGARRSR